jgi:hypothetical protein
VLEQQSDHSFAERVDEQIRGPKGDAVDVEEISAKVVRTEVLPEVAPPPSRLTKRRPAQQDGEKPTVKGKREVPAKGSKGGVKGSKTTPKPKAVTAPIQLLDEGNVWEYLICEMRTELTTFHLFSK